MSLEKDETLPPSPKKSVLIIGGVSESLRNFRGPLIESFRLMGFEVHVAASNFSEELASYFTSNGIQVHEIKIDRTGINPRTDLRTAYQIYKLVSNIKPDIFLAYTIKPVIYGLLACKFAKTTSKKAALITGLGYAFTNSRKGLISKIAKILYRTALKNADVIFFQNPDDRQTFNDESIIGSNSKTVVINGSGVDLDRFNLTPLPTGKVSFLMIGRLLGDKGVREYIEAAKIITSKYTNVTFNLVGSIDSNPNSISESELLEWKNSGVISYWGRVSDVRPAITASHIYVLPSYREGTPRTVLEAMAMGRAIITTNAPGCRETVKNNINGFLVPIKSVSALVSSMEKFLKDETLIAAMGQASYRIACEKYDVHKVNALIIKNLI